MKIHEKAMETYDEFRSAINALVNGWFKHWWQHPGPLTDDDWIQLSDELDTIYTNHHYQIIREIGVSLLAELERRHK